MHRLKKGIEIKSQHQFLFLGTVNNLLQKKQNN
jgi:hypothetical protein